ncbi:hypothetical protein Tel_06220 [Candidatus Tenderia electrophaga]|uniref:TMEM205-like domain-containing protein n=1 Tax=Candidatus Tenderia electrophaga TaxID=1748243 RepID=A0A0S2TCA5_9GAMM|nr:hypothetical protein Tel_06220 [Candidatus Tenderia electrophaga]
MTRKFLVGLESVLQTLWVGGLWVIGYLVAPILFASLDERRLAGELAGHMFTAMNYVGLVCGGLLLIFALLRAGRAWLKELRVIALVSMLALVLISLFVLQPMMQELKLAGLTPGSEAAGRFGMLHGVSSILYLITSLLGLLLVVRRETGDYRSR